MCSALTPSLLLLLTGSKSIHRATMRDTAHLQDSLPPGGVPALLLLEDALGLLPGLGLPLHPGPLCALPGLVRLRPRGCCRCIGSAPA